MTAALRGAPTAQARREKLFGDGRSRPLDRNAKARIMARAHALSRRTEKGKHYGQITAKGVEVLGSLLWIFHNCATGRCFPSYQTIADAAGCARSTVAAALKDLEAAGLLTWVNRIKHVREDFIDLFGQRAERRRVVRTSNGYRFNDPGLSQTPAVILQLSRKSEFQSGTANQDLFSTKEQRSTHKIDPETALEQALKRLEANIQNRRGDRA
jgi:hypothetical protein